MTDLTLVATAAKAIEAADQSLTVQGPLVSVLDTDLGVLAADIGSAQGLPANVQKNAMIAVEAAMATMAVVDVLVAVSPNTAN